MQELCVKPALQSGGVWFSGLLCILFWGCCAPGGVMVLRMLCTWCVNGYGVAVHLHCGLVRTSGLRGGKTQIKKGEYVHVHV